MVERRAVNALVVGSSPTEGANLIGIWCNGSTGAFEALCLGSTPSVPAIRYWFIV